VRIVDIKGVVGKSGLGLRLLGLRVRIAIKAIYAVELHFPPPPNPQNPTNPNPPPPLPPRSKPKSPSNPDAKAQEC
jgi:hypothetical protein